MSTKQCYPSLNKGAQRAQLLVGSAVAGVFGSSTELYDTVTISIQSSKHIDATGALSVFFTNFIQWGCLARSVRPLT